MVFLLRRFFLLLAIVLIGAGTSYADQGYSSGLKDSTLKRPTPSKRNPAFSVPPKMRPRVNFWIDIFAKYGKYQAVIHHRTFPHITFEVLDFRKVAERMSAGALERYREKKFRERRAVIIKALKHLAAGRAPRNELERRIQSEMSILGRGSAKYKKVINEKLIRSQRGIREKYVQAIERSGRYMHVLEEIFVREHGLPVELTRLPFVESSFDYKAYSSVGAAGIWQFMPRTAKVYKMKINRYVDERRDVVSATRGAAQYLRDAYKRLGTWPLALTSYNHGVGGVSKKVRKLGTRDIATILETQKKQLFGFASQNFYPEFLAALEIYENLDRYFPSVTPEAPVYLAGKKLTESVPVGMLQRKIGVDLQSLKDVNYALSKHVWSGRYQVPKGYVLKVPQNYRRQLAGLTLPPAPKRETASSVYGGIVYRVRRGDSLSSIARKYKTSVAKLKDYNDLRSDSIRVGQTLIVKPRDRFASAPQKMPSSKTYTVRKGDSLYSIAKRYGLTAGALRQMNRLRTSKIYIGQKLKLSQSGGSSTGVQPRPSQKVSAKYYTVRRGDTLWSISAAQGLSVGSLKKLNRMRSSKIKAGQRLRVR